MSNEHPIIPVVVAGCNGRMGKVLMRMVSESDDFMLAGALEHENSPVLGAPAKEVEEHASESVTVQSDPAAVFNSDRIVIDFTRPEATREFLNEALNTETKLVIGTTGLSQDDFRLLEEVSEQTSIVQAPNMSVGINLLLDLIDQTTKCLGDDFDVEILEMHHRHKEDAPSGTADLLADRVARARHDQLKNVKKIGREGFEGERPPEEIGISSVRGGDVVGDHTVMFAGEGERIELTHKASSRQTFARGALRAARFLEGESRGLFSMKEVLGL